MEETTKVISYKGFTKDLTCRDFQFEIGKSYSQEGEIVLCEKGFHACEYPLSVFSYYSPTSSRFAKVLQSGTVLKGDSKIVCSEIEIIEEVSLSQLILAAVDYTFSHSVPSGAASATGTQGAASATGTRGAANASGYQGAANASGNYGAANASGNQGAANASGKHSVAVATGVEGKALAGETGAMVLVYRDPSSGEILQIKASKVGENGVKPNVWYTLSETGEFQEFQKVI